MQCVASFSFISTIHNMDINVHMGNYLKSCLEGEREFIASKCLNVIEALALLLIQLNDWCLLLQEGILPSYMEAKINKAQ